MVQRPVALFSRDRLDKVPLPTAGDNLDGLSTATAAEGATPMARDPSRG
jgi:hypothetical protein